MLRVVQVRARVVVSSGSRQLNQLFTFPSTSPVFRGNCGTAIFYVKSTVFVQEMATVFPIADLREMAQNQIMKLNKDTLIASIRASNDNGEALNQALHKKMEEISKELIDLKSQLSSPECGINQRITKLQEKVDKQAYCQPTKFSGGS